MAGVAALMLRVDPTLTPREIKEKIMESADIVTDLYDANVAGGRRLNAYLAVKAALGSTTAELDAIRLDPLPEIKRGDDDFLESFADYTSAPYPKGGVDSDSNGLIEIVTRRQLNNIRYNLAGTSYKTHADHPGVTTGCPSAGCYGYELMEEIDFKESAFRDTIFSYVDHELSDGSQSLFTASKGWIPIGDEGNPFTGTFDGGNYTIKNLIIKHGDSGLSFVAGTG